MLAEIFKWLFCLSAGFMFSCGGAVVYDYCRGRRMNRCYVVIALVSCLFVVVSNQLF